VPLSFGERCRRCLGGENRSVEEATPSAGLPQREFAWLASPASIAFNGVHDDLTDLLGRIGPGPERDRVADLLKPMEEMLERQRKVAAGAAAQPTDIASGEAATGETTAPAEGSDEQPS
jgi:hypothetical protein